MFARIAGVKMSNLSKIYYLLKNLDNLEIKISELEIAKQIEDDAYGNLWYEEKIDEAQQKLDRIKSLLEELVKKL
jgi:division protein CdvB (Snf7/Vps24/ESCRT-III family)